MKKIKKLRVIMLIAAITLFIIFGLQAYTATYTNMNVHWLDVGESDCVLIESAGKYMLIDAGNNGDGDDIVDYLKELKVHKLDYIICSHPHADHIGGMDDVIENFEIGKVLMPEKENTTKTFEDVLSAIKNKGLKITLPKVGDKYTIGKASFTIIAPNSDNYGSNINNYSIGIKLVNGKTSFIFIGDSETEAIDDILDNGISLKADVYMCGHHGSDTSTTKELLKSIAPEYAIISVGKNSYGHPGDSTLMMLDDSKIKTFRTDENGTIVATSTGTKLTFKVSLSQPE